MGQLSLYFPDDLEEAIKKKATQEKKSTSAYVTSLVKKDLESGVRLITESFLSLAGTCPDFPLFEEDDLPPKNLPAFQKKKTPLHHPRKK